MLIVGTLLLSWLGMMIVHEGGHVVNAWATGGRVDKVVLHPLAISRTDVNPNPRPLIVVWGGPIWGCLVPLFTLLWMRWRQFRHNFLFAFFAGFCLVANGAYLGVGVWFPVGDALELLHLGTPLWLLGAFGVCASSLGFWLWNGLGSHFGLAKTNQSVEPRVVLSVWIALVLAIVAECLLSAKS